MNIFDPDIYVVEHSACPPEGISSYSLHLTSESAVEEFNRIHKKYREYEEKECDVPNLIKHATDGFAYLTVYLYEFDNEKKDEDDFYDSFYDDES